MTFRLNYVCFALVAMTSSAHALTLTDVSVTNPKIAGFAAPNMLSPELDMRL